MEAVHPVRAEGGHKAFFRSTGCVAGNCGATLTVQLRQLEADEVVVRHVCADIPVRIEYALSEYGAILSGVMDQLEAWREISGASEQRRIARTFTRSLTFP